MTLRYGIDIGATSIKGTAVDDDGQERAVHTVVCPSTGTAADVEDAVADCFGALVAAAPGGVGLGLGAPGWVDSDRNTVRYSPNLPWRDEPLGDRVAARTGMPVVVENDANAAAWGEYRFGAGRSVESLVMITLGSGVGGAIVVGGTLLRGHRGAAGEIGHSAPVETRGILCSCGRRGCMENYVSGRAAARRGLFPPDDADVPDALWYSTFARDLASGLAQVTLLLNPEMVVIGGGVADSFDRFAEELENSLTDELRSWSGLEPRLAKAELGQAAGRIGAADLAEIPSAATSLPAQPSPSDRSSTH